VSLEQRVRAMRRNARNDFYRNRDIYGRKITNWRMLIARRLRVPVAEVRRALGERES
jgi:hypothetical protein